uniref:Uncharacterized protein n=1 Tax=Anguilla anguilla TaxID=7936 RepID=A0A0E9WJQ0_ANGAN
MSLIWAFPLQYLTFRHLADISRQSFPEGLTLLTFFINSQIFCDAMQVPGSWLRLQCPSWESNPQPSESQPQFPKHYTSTATINPYLSQRDSISCLMEGVRRGAASDWMFFFPPLDPDWSGSGNETGTGKWFCVVL